MQGNTCTVARNFQRAMATTSPNPSKPLSPIPDLQKYSTPEGDSRSRCAIWAIISDADLVCVISYSGKSVGIWFTVLPSSNFG